MHTFLAVNGVLMIRYFCTYFDRYYVTLGLALYESLRRFCPQFRLWVLCLDEETFELLSELKLAQVRLVKLQEFEAWDKDLLVAKANRNRLEYYFTCTPILPGFVLQDAPEVEMVTYLDADLWFFANPEGIYEEIGTHSIAIVGHRYASGALFLEEPAGVYNVSWVSFRRDAEAMACLARWRQQCLEWCYNRSEQGRNADQKYLDEWPNKYPNLKVIEQIGAGAAPWNIQQYRISTKGEQIFLDDQPLYFYHFHGVKQVVPRVYDPVLSHFKACLSPLLKELIYKSYLCRLEAISQRVIGSKKGSRYLTNLRTQSCQTSLSKELSLLRRIRRGIHVVKMVIAGIYIFIPDMGKRIAQLKNDKW